jgi:hypothetical protein
MEAFTSGDCKGSLSQFGFTTVLRNQPLVLGFDLTTVRSVIVVNVEPKILELGHVALSNSNRVWGCRFGRMSVTITTSVSGSDWQ